MNVTALTGRIAKDARVRTTGTGKRVADFAIAVPRRFPPSDPAQSPEDILRVRAWTDTADFVVRETAKGMTVELSGRIEIDRYKEAGGMNDQVIIVAERIEVLRGAPVRIEDVDEFDPREVLNPQMSSVARHMGGTGDLR